MKVLGGIPTRMRSSSGKIADTLAEVCDDVFVVSQSAICNYSKPNVTVLEYPQNFGLVPARNEILKFGKDYDIIIQSDDDLSFTSELINELITVLIDNPTIGAICSISRAYWNWNKEVTSTKPFVLSPCTPQLWAARVSILKEVGPWTLPFLEDREHGCRMWRAGYACVQLHKGIRYTHNPFVARTNVEGKQTSGGQEEGVGEERHAGLKKAIEFMNANYSDLVSIKYLGIKERTFSTRYNWNNLMKGVVKRFGLVLDYEDSKGRRL